VEAGLPFPSRGVRPIPARGISFSPAALQTLYSRFGAFVQNVP
jgi:hypothetical protein